MIASVRIRTFRDFANGGRHSVDPEGMASIVFILGLLAASTVQQESTCLGFIQDSFLPMNVYIAGTASEGSTALAAQGEIVYLNGPGLASLRPGDLFQVVRPEGRVKDPVTGKSAGIYYRELGTVRIETGGAKSQTAYVMSNCRAIMKGDLVVPLPQRAEVALHSQPSGRLDPVPEQGLASHIILGLDDRRELGTGDVCFIGVGRNDGIQEGDRFTVWRPQPRFDRQDLTIAELSSTRSYQKPLDPLQKYEQVRTLNQRELPKRVIGNLVILATNAKTSVARITSSYVEIHLGDFVVRQ